MKREKVQRLQSLADRAFDAIEEMIVGGDLVPAA
jgi:DNA-binding GntR family transcriptional regulator